MKKTDWKRFMKAPKDTLTCLKTWEIRYFKLKRTLKRHAKPSIVKMIWSNLPFNFKNMLSHLELNGYRQDIQNEKKLKFKNLIRYLKLNKCEKRRNKKWLRKLMQNSSIKRTKWSFKKLLTFLKRQRKSQMREIQIMYQF